MDRLTSLSAWLARVARSRHAPSLVLRGSLVTARLVPERVAHDVDLLVLGVDSFAALTRVVDELLDDPTPDGLPAPLAESTWVETAWPGLRLRFGESLQVDLGFGDPLATPPVPVTIAGSTLLAVSPEVMAAWKAHGIVEHGRGRFRGKDILDLLALLERVRPFDPDAFARALELAFGSRGTPLSAFDELLHDRTWGNGRSSTRKWRQFERSGLVPAPLPPLSVLVERVRAALAPVVARLAADAAQKSRATVSPAITPSR